MWSRFPVLSLFAFILVLSGCARTLPVYNVINASAATASGKQITQTQVGDAITKAAREKGWHVTMVSNGHIEATIHVRQHTAVVDIHYSAESYDITYKSSSELLYDGEKIHRNYNKWVIYLEHRINKALNGL